MGTPEDSGWEEGQPVEDLHQSDGGERQGLVHELGNGKKALQALARLHERFEQANRDLAIDKKFDVEYE